MHHTVLIYFCVSKSQRLARNSSTWVARIADRIFGSQRQGAHISQSQESFLIWLHIMIHFWSWTLNCHVAVGLAFRMSTNFRHLLSQLTGSRCNSSHLRHTLGSYSSAAGRSFKQISWMLSQQGVHPRSKVLWNWHFEVNRARSRINALLHGELFHIYLFPVADASRSQSKFSDKKWDRLISKNGTACQKPYDFLRKLRDCLRWLRFSI